MNYFLKEKNVPQTHIYVSVAKYFLFIVERELVKTSAIYTHFKSLSRVIHIKFIEVIMAMAKNCL